MERAEMMKGIKEMVYEKVDEFRKEFEPGGSLQGVANAHQATKLDKIRDYLHLLYDAHKVDHRVDKEIEEALKMYRAEAEI
jgi:rhamnogalacturonyl hydrolase YesR